MTMQTDNKTPANQTYGIEAMYRQMMFHDAELNRLAEIPYGESVQESDEQYEWFCAIQDAIIKAPIKTTKEATLKIAVTAMKLNLLAAANYDDSSEARSIQDAMKDALLSSIKVISKDFDFEDSLDIKDVARLCA